jgi:hypothetical protein
MIAGVDIAKAIGGRRGLLDSGLPGLVFVGVYTFSHQDLRAALISSLTVAGLITGLRIVRRQPLTQAFAGFVGVAVASIIAHRTGEARNYFITGFLANGAYLLACVISVFVRWPLAGVVLGPLLGEGMTWRDVPGRYSVYRTITWIFAGVFSARLIVQGYLYYRDDVLWLGVSKFVMGLPLYLAAAAFGYWMIRRAPPPQHEAKSTGDSD